MDLCLSKIPKLKPYPTHDVTVFRDRDFKRWLRLSEVVEVEA